MNDTINTTGTDAARLVGQESEARSGAESVTTAIASSTPPGTTSAPSTDLPASQSEAYLSAGDMAPPGSVAPSDGLADEPDQDNPADLQLSGENPGTSAAQEEARSVPLARLQGVQRLLSRAERNLNQVERERDHFKVLAGDLQQQLAAANKQAAVEYMERIKATSHDIVPELIQGETIEQVEQALTSSRAAFAAARAAYARAIPTPASRTGGPSAMGEVPAGAPGNPIDLISRGLHQTTNDINQ